MIGKTVSHYTILEELGRGGMGVVYKAEDTKLHRTVALKFLPPEFTRDPEAKERFSHEAQAAAALNHPNICTVYEIDEHEGQSFIAMEHIEGRGLKSMIAGGPLKLAASLDIAMQLAGGLAEAHDKDVVHRDIKPANIMITAKGRVKIMDFGLAKLRSQTVLTKEGTTLGTVAYMSPEQARGRPVDRRTDIWSLGVVLYEMIAGKRPFEGEYDQAMIYSVLNNAPEPLTAVRSGVPAELERIVCKCLEKDPAERYQTAVDLMADFRHFGRIISEGAPASRSVGPQATMQQPPVEQIHARRMRRRLPWVIVSALAVVLAAVFFSRYFKPAGQPAGDRTASDLKMLVVLPFENLGPPEDEYFADGITDAITARLAGLSGLGVISRQSAIQYKDRTKRTKEISEELGVDYILEGTIQRERPNDLRSRVRIIPQLIKCPDDIHLWAATYDEEMTEVFRLQSEIAERVARELDVALLEPERRALASKPTENLEAYEYYLQGIEYANRALDEETARQSIEMFKKSVELDREFSLAWARLSRAYTWLYWITWIQEILTRARGAAEEALRIDPDLPEARLALGFIYYYGSLDYERALEQFDSVRKQWPGNVDAIRAAGYIKRRQGKWEEALRLFEQAIKMDPRSYINNWDNFGNTYMLMRRYSEAETWVDKAMSLEPDMPEAYISKAMLAILGNGDREKARLHLLEALDRLPPERKCSIFSNVDYWITRICRDSPCDLIDRMNPALCRLSTPYDSASFYLEKAECCTYRNRAHEARTYMDSARVTLEREMQSTKQLMPHIYTFLGNVYAYLGLKDKAIQTGEWSVTMLPVSKDAFDGSDRLLVLAEIYTLTGEYESALDELERLLSIPSAVSVHSIRLDPIWDPLRDNPRYRKMLDKHAGDGS